jgi:3-deoxy-D-manno-octulosonic-acid transferase
VNALYRLAMSIAYSAIYPYARLRASGGKELWRGRIGLIPEVGPRDVWLHAASVGEAKVASYLVDYLRKRRSDISIHVTVMTTSGFEAARKLLPADVTMSYFPIDSRGAIARVFERIQPKLIGVAETEIWPNLVNVAADKQVALVLFNGRMSDKAFKRYRYIKTFLGKLLDSYSRFFVKTIQDLERFTFFGVPRDRVEVAGDMKFDAPLMMRSEGRIKELRYRAGIGDEDFLLVAGSTRPGEEELLIDEYLTIKANHPHFRLLLAPRHVERAGEVAALLQARSIPFHIYGQEPVSDNVVIVDRMGILMELYQAANLAFVGGTLVMIGGHNVLEPVWAGTPVVFGPSCDNVLEAAGHVLQHDFGVQIQSASELGALVEEMISGTRTFKQKTETDLHESATASAGEYILRKIQHA